jgi:hypothetical protein
VHSADDLIYDLSQRGRWPVFHTGWRVLMLGLGQRRTMSRIVIPKNEFLIHGLVVIGIHQPRFRQTDVYKLPKVQLRSVTELKYTGDETS